MSEPIWKIPYTDPDSRALEEDGISRLLAKILASRGITSPRAAHAILDIGPDSLHDPLRILGMQEARDRLLPKLLSGEIEV